MKSLFSLLVLSAWLACVGSVRAQNYALNWFTVDGGGGVSTLRRRGVLDGGRVLGDRCRDSNFRSAHARRPQCQWHVGRVLAASGGRIPSGANQRARGAARSDFLEHRPAGQLPDQCLEHFHHSAGADRPTILSAPSSVSRPRPGRRERTISQLRLQLGRVCGIKRQLLAATAALSPSQLWCGFCQNWESLYLGSWV